MKTNSINDVLWGRGLLFSYLRKWQFIMLLLLISLSINAQSKLKKPKAFVVQPSCTIETAVVKIKSPKSRTTYILKQNDVNIYTADSNGIISSVVSGSYELTATQGNRISKPITIEINAQPVTPWLPCASISQPSCEIGSAVVNVELPLEKLSYKLLQNGTAKYSAKPDGIFYDVTSGNYKLIATNNSCSSAESEVTVNPPPKGPIVPLTQIRQPTCAISTATLTLQSAVDGINYELKQNGLSKYRASTSGVFNFVEPGMYKLTATGLCTANGPDVIVNKAPDKPVRPIATAIQPTCEVPTAVVKIASPSKEVNYSLTANGFVKYTATAAAIFTGVKPGEYLLVGVNSRCSTPGANITINPQPKTPAAPVICMVMSTKDSFAIESLTILSPVEPGIEYSVDNGITWVKKTIFSNLILSKLSGVKTRQNGCVSNSTTRSSNECESQISGNYASTVRKQELDKSITNFDVHSLPFKNRLIIKYKFDFKTNVKIEVFNSVHRLVYTNTDNNAYYGKEVILDISRKLDKNFTFIVKLTTNRGNSNKYASP